MNVTSERAREACETCRKSHKKCEYDVNSTRCLRCERRNSPCSLFPPVQTTTAVPQQGHPAPRTTISAPESWGGPPHYDPNHIPYQPVPQDYYWTPETTQGEYPTDMMFQQSTHQDQEAMNQDGWYDHHNAYSDHDDGT